MVPAALIRTCDHVQGYLNHLSGAFSSSPDSLISPNNHSIRAPPTMNLAVTRPTVLRYCTFPPPLGTPSHAPQFPPQAASKRSTTSAFFAVLGSSIHRASWNIHLREIIGSSFNSSSNLYSKSQPEREASREGSFMSISFAGADPRRAASIARR